jgi:hypothetical protein
MALIPSEPMPCSAGTSSKVSQTHYCKRIHTNPHAPPNLALTATETCLLDHLVRDKGKPSDRKSISRYIVKIARLGGYLARASDPPPGNIVMWRGLSRLTDIELGALAGAKLVGN